MKKKMLDLKLLGLTGKGHETEHRGKWMLVQGVHQLFFRNETFELIAKVSYINNHMISFKEIIWEKNFEGGRLTDGKRIRIAEDSKDISGNIYLYGLRDGQREWEAVKGKYCWLTEEEAKSEALGRKL